MDVPVAALPSLPCHQSADALEDLQELDAIPWTSEPLRFLISGTRNKLLSYARAHLPRIQYNAI